MTLRGLTVVAAVALLLPFGTTAWAKKGGPKPTPAQKCTAGKLRTAGRYELCRLAAEAAVVATAGTPDFSKCDATITAKWSKIESKAKGACPVTADVGSVQTEVTADATALAGAISPP
jgi:hypothetical protein